MKNWKIIGLILIILLAVVAVSGCIGDDSDSDSPVLDVDAINITEDGTYDSKEEVAAYISEYHKLPSNYITKREVTLTFGISKLEEILKSSNNRKNRFIRLGRSFIINHSFLHKIDVLEQQLILSDGDKNEVRIKLPKLILKSYKTATIKSIQIKEDKS